MPFLESFRAVRWLRTMNLVLQAVLFLTLFAGLNYIARNHPWRIDITRSHRYSLSAESVSYLRSLPRTVHIYATVSEEVDIPVEVRGLIDEFVHATEPNPTAHITKEYVSVYQNRRRAEELGLEQPNVLLLVCGDRRSAVPVNELYRMKNSRGEVAPEAFQGEEVLMSRILEVSSQEQPHIYFLVGHGELQPDDTNPARGLSTLRDQLKVRNFDVQILDLSVARKIPDNATLLVTVAPQTAYSRAEQELLRQYLSVKAGRLLLLLSPGISTVRLGLDELLLDWGVIAYDDLVIEPDAQYRTDDGDLIIKALQPHPITDTLVTYRMYLRFGYTRTVMPDPTRSPANGLTAVTIAATSTGAWGDVGYRVGLPPKFSNPGNTHPLPGMKPEDRLGVVVASERVAPRKEFTVRAGRVVVFGTGDFVANQRITNGGNALLFLGAVNWAIERAGQLNVPARPIQRFQLSISASELNRLNYTLWFALPGIAALLGIMVYWTRRK